jgi:predicted transcriptional regulator
MANNKQTENLNIIQIFLNIIQVFLTTCTLSGVKKKMEVFLKQEYPILEPEIYNQIMEGKRDIDWVTIHILAHSHNVCIRVKNHPDKKVHKVHNKEYSANTVNLDFKNFYKTNVGSKRQREETGDLPLSKFKKTTNQQNETNKEKFKKYIGPIFLEAKKECETLAFENLNCEKHHNTMIKYIRQTNTAHNTDKFEFFSWLKSICLKKFNKCMKACSNFFTTNLLEVEEYINKNMIVVESILYTYLHKTIYTHYKNGMNEKNGKMRYLYEKMKEIPLNEVKEKLLNFLQDYVNGFNDFIQES